MLLAGRTLAEFLLYFNFPVFLTQGFSLGAVARFLLVVPHQAAGAFACVSVCGCCALLKANNAILLEPEFVALCLALCPMPFENFLTADSWDLPATHL